MSAPIRPFQPSEDRNAQQKKRLRRKKVAPVELDTFNQKLAYHQQYQNKIMVEKSYDERPTTAKVFTSRFGKSAKPPKPTAQPRARSAIHGSEIVTLVSLLSPGASDSEKEDHSNGTNDSPNEKHAPSLRKVGKSGKLNPLVRDFLFCLLFMLNKKKKQIRLKWFNFLPTQQVSFQDDDNFTEEDPIIDLPSVLRRASLVPLAAKIRLNRPPTAPPGSIFYKSNIIR